jgi:trimeric autotransporter adhesin
MKTTPHFIKVMQRHSCMLCILLTAFISAHTQNIDFGKSFINVTKGASGGTVEPGDVLEIRASFVVRSGTYDSCGYFDAIPAGTSFIPGTIRVLTNEGKTYKQFTDVAGDDCGWIAASAVRINLGYATAARPATAFRRGRVANTHKPSFFGSTCIMVASFRVTVTTSYNTTIDIGKGSMTYKSGLGALQTFAFPSHAVMIYLNYGICSNTVGANALGTEFNGTFGSGKPRNRGSSANVPTGYTYNTFTSNMPNDYYYGVANNTSTDNGYTTLNTWAKPDGSAPTHRVFQVWDIIGDHTGAASTTLGNSAADTVANANAGYMLVINAAYRIDSAFQQTITNLCPNTYYEVSCWLRNICSKCGCDSNGTGASNGGYIPTAAGDSSGVAPNITFSLNDVGYYTTGNIPYSGTWIKKGFTFLTGGAQTSFTMKFFNNAPGGGGNDWALDDISVATCTPNLTLLPSSTPLICSGNTVDMSTIVKSFFNNYAYYKWQKSTDNGATWIDDGAAGGPASPVWTGTEWQYTVLHPTIVANQPDSGTKYRTVIATTSGNLTNASCAFSQSTVITLSVQNCGPVLSTDLLSFNAKKSNNIVQLHWTTSKEEEAVRFGVEKSLDAVRFNTLAMVDGYGNGDGLNNYFFADRDSSQVLVYYRIHLTDAKGSSKYSRVIQLNGGIGELSLAGLANPFVNDIQFQLISQSTAHASVKLVGIQGAVLRANEFMLNNGVNNLQLKGAGGLPPGVYILQVEVGEKLLQRKIVKTFR